MDKHSISIVKTLFGEYYRKTDLLLPPDYELREFALQPIELDTYIRHLSFTSKHELKNYILRNVPRHLYVSSAKYRYPSNPDMESKEWLGSDLVFDIDADHVPACIDRVVEYRYCPKCKYVARGDEKECPNCGSKFEKFEHVDPSCVEEAKNELTKLIDIVENELGYRTFETVFSGHRGFHLVVYLPPEDSSMPSEARRELVDYLRGALVENLDLKVELKKVGRKKVLKLPPRVGDGGVRRRVALYVAKKVMDVDLRNFLLGLSNAVPVHKLRMRWNDINELIDEALQQVFVSIDEKVTIDVSRLMRIPMSINGKSGWLALPINDVSSFELAPQVLSPFHGTKIRVRIEVPLPKITVFDEEVNVSVGEVLVMDASIALYLVLKGVAKALNIVR